MFRDLRVKWLGSRKLLRQQNKMRRTSSLTEERCKENSETLRREMKNWKLRISTYRPDLINSMLPSQNFWRNSSDLYKLSSLATIEPTKISVLLNIMIENIAMITKHPDWQRNKSTVLIEEIILTFLLCDRFYKHFY